MSEAHPDADLVKVTRTTTTYEAASKQTPLATKPGNRMLLWVVGICIVAAIAAGGIFFYNAQISAAPPMRNAVAGDHTGATTRAAPARAHAAKTTPTN